MSRRLAGIKKYILKILSMLVQLLGVHSLKGKTPALFPYFTILYLGSQSLNLE